MDQWFETVVEDEIARADLVARMGALRNKAGHPSIEMWEHKQLIAGHPGRRLFFPPETVRIEGMKELLIEKKAIQSAMPHDPENYHCIRA